MAQPVDRTARHRWRALVLAVGLVLPLGGTAIAAAPAAQAKETPQACAGMKFNVMYKTVDLVAACTRVLSCDVCPHPGDLTDLFIAG
jgi:hypothetical protein